MAGSSGDDKTMVDRTGASGNGKCRSNISGEWMAQDRKEGRERAMDMAYTMKWQQDAESVVERVWRSLHHAECVWEIGGDEECEDDSIGTQI